MLAAYEPAAGQRAFEEAIVHTGQHYDPAMSDIFFDEMDIPRPVVNLHVGSGGHSATTGAMLEGIERELLPRKPDWVLVYGDTNSTLAGALAAAATAHSHRACGSRVALVQPPHAGGDQSRADRSRGHTAILSEAKTPSKPRSRRHR